MSSKKPPPAASTSGQHPAVIAFRQKIDSIAETTMPQVQALNQKLKEMKRKSDPPSRPDRCSRCKRIVRSEDESCPAGGEHEFVKETP